ncbi:MAG: hypothetical protein QXO16_06240 [Archaeoglobaceae archaeon]
MPARNIRLQTTIDREVYEKIIRKWLPRYESLNRLLESALKTFDMFMEYSGQEPNEKDLLVLKMIREVGMILIGYETAEAAASGDLERIVYENEVRFLMEWYYKKPIEKISLEDAVRFMKIILPAMNIAMAVEIQKVGNEYHVLVSSKMKKNFNALLCEVLKSAYERYYGVKVDYSVFAHGFEITIF